MSTLFVSALAAGVLWALWLLPRGEVARGYEAWMAVVSAAVSGALLALRWPDPWAGAAVGGALFFRFLPGRLALGVASILSGACLLHPLSGALPRLSVSLSALVLGTTLDAMVLGHWYLVQHGLSFRPLTRMTLAMLGALAARLLLALVSLFAMGEWGRLLGSDPLPQDRVVFLLLRGLLGLAGPLGLGWMVWSCVRIKSNTSATGILYVVVVFVLVGEFTSAWFLATLGACL